MKSKTVMSLVVAVAFAVAAQVTGYAEGKDLVKANIPQIYGKSKQAFTGSDQKTIICIQDAHGNAEAQENIQAIVKSLSEQGKVDAISDEGEWNEFSLERYSKLNDEQRAAVIDWETKYGIVHGASRVMALDNKNMKVFGNEDKNLYMDGKKSLQTSFASAKEGVAAAEKIKASLEALKLKLFDDETRNLLQAIEDFQNDKITLTAYAKVLKQAAEKSTVKWNSYANFSKVIESVTLEDSIDFAKIDRERLDMVDALEAKVDKKTTDEIVNKSLNYRLGRLSAADYYDFLLNKAGEAKLDMAKFGNVEKYAKLVKLYAQINDDELFSETGRLETEIKGKLFKSDAQVKFDKYVKGIDILTKMMNLQMTRADIAYYTENKPKAAEAIAFLKTQGLSVDEALSKIDASLSSNEKFYEIAMKRDEAMIKNTLAMMDERGFKTVVLVAGGFHTEGIMKELKNKNISHMIVTPRITNPDAPNYWKQLMTGEQTDATKMMKKYGADYYAATTQGSTDPNGSKAPSMIITTEMAQEIMNGNQVAVLKDEDAVKDVSGADLSKLVNDAKAEKGKVLSGFDVVGVPMKGDFFMVGEKPVAVIRVPGTNKLIVSDAARAALESGTPSLLSTLMGVFFENERREIANEKGEHTPAALNQARLDAMQGITNGKKDDAKGVEYALASLILYEASKRGIDLSTKSADKLAEAVKEYNDKKTTLKADSSEMPKSDAAIMQAVFGNVNIPNAQELAIAVALELSKIDMADKTRSIADSVAEVNDVPMKTVMMINGDMTQKGDGDLAQLKHIINTENFKTVTGSTINALGISVKDPTDKDTMAGAQDFAERLKAVKMDGRFDKVQAISLSDFKNMGAADAKTFYLVVTNGADLKKHYETTPDSNIVFGMSVQDRDATSLSQFKSNTRVAKIDPMGGSIVLSRLAQIKGMTGDKRAGAEELVDKVLKYGIKLQDGKKTNDMVTAIVNWADNKGDLDFDQFLKVSDLINFMGTVDPYVGKYA